MIVMFSNFETAEKMSSLLSEVSGILDESVAIMFDSDSPEDEKSRYMGIVGQLLGMITIDVLNPLYKQHPTLKPDEYYLP